MEEALELVKGLGVNLTLFNGTCPITMPGLEFSAGPPAVGDIHEIADGAGDSVYVALAISSLCGITLDPITDAICDNNLAKFGPGHTYKDGKLIKPPGHPKPPIAELLREQMLEAIRQENP